ncbi:MAG TPA: prenyltransferase, partial [Salinimicrobium sp.]|nr:prenyltransferase [Salinimicrobium sp.]
TGVLNLNNIRDRAADEKAGKITVVVKLGTKKAKKYHFWLIMIAITSMLLYTALTFTGMIDLIYFIAFVPLLLHLKRIMENETPEHLDPELKKLALSTFMLAVLFSVGQVL